VPKTAQPLPLHRMCAGKLGWATITLSSSIRRRSENDLRRGFFPDRHVATSLWPRLSRRWRGGDTPKGAAPIQFGCNGTANDVMISPYIFDGTVLRHSRNACRLKFCVACCTGRRKTADVAPRFHTHISLQSYCFDFVLFFLRHHISRSGNITPGCRVVFMNPYLKRRIAHAQAADAHKNCHHSCRGEGNAHVACDQGDGKRTVARI
jgi:hypothetical protein